MKKVLLSIIFIIVFSCFLFSNELLLDLDLIFTSNDFPDTSNYTSSEIISLNQRANYYFNNGIVYFNNTDYRNAAKYFATTITIIPWDIKTYLWYEKSLIKLGELDYLKDFYARFVEFGLYEKYFSKKLEFVNNLKKYEILSPDFDYYLFDTITGFGIRLRERYFMTPADILYHNRKLYVVCPSLKQISIFDRNFNFIKRMRFSGKPLKLTSSKNNIYSFEFDNNNIYRITSSGLTKIDTHEIDFLGIKGIAVDSHENIYVYDSGNRRIVKFNDNRKLMEIRARNIPGVNFANVTAIEIDNNNNLFVVNNNEKVIYKFDVSGNLISSFDFSMLTDNLYDIKFRNNYLYILLEDYSLYVVDIMFNFIKKISVTDEHKSSPAYSFDIDHENNIFISNYYDSVIEIYKDKMFANTPLIINVDRINSINFYPLLAKYINVFDIYGNKVYDLHSNHLELFEGFPDDEDEMLWKASYYVHNPVDTKVIIKDGIFYIADTEILDFRRNFLVFPSNIRPVNRLDIFNNLDLSVVIFNNEFFNEYKTNFTYYYNQFLNNVNFRNTLIDFYKISETDTPILKKSTDIFQMRRELRYMEYVSDKDMNVFKSLNNLFHKKAGGAEKNRAVILFLDNTNYSFERNELEFLINFLTFNDIPLIIYSFEKEKNQQLQKIVDLTSGNYSLYPDFNFKNDLEFIVNRPVNRYVVTYETGYTNLIVNSYLPVYLFINRFNSSGAALTGYLTPARR